MEERNDEKLGIIDGTEIQFLAFFKVLICGEFLTSSIYFLFFIIQRAPPSGAIPDSGIQAKKIKNRLAVYYT